MVDKTSLGVAVVAILIALVAVWQSSSLSGQVSSISAVQGTDNALEGEQTAMFGTLNMRLGDLESKYKRFSTPPGTAGGIVQHFLTIENGKWYPDLIVAYEGDLVKLNIANKDPVDRSFTLDAMGGVNIKVPAGNSSGVKDMLPATTKLAPGIYRFYSTGDAPAGDPRSGGYLVVLRS